MDRKKLMTKRGFARNGDKSDDFDPKSKKIGQKATKTFANQRLANLRTFLGKTNGNSSKTTHFPRKTNDFCGFIKKSNLDLIQEHRKSEVKKRLSVEIDKFSSVFDTNLDNKLNNNEKKVDNYGSSTSFATINDDINNDELMDWCTINPEVLNSDIKMVREKLKNDNITTTTHNNNNMSKQQPESAQMPSETITTQQTNEYVVTDTNIFIDKLEVIKDILKITYQDGSFPVVYVPWMVLQELDYFKDGYSVSASHDHSRVIQARSRQAIALINHELTAANTHRANSKARCTGQSVVEASEQQVVGGGNPDDAIIACCLQLAAKHTKLVLLSNDTNLRNKALINKLEAQSAAHILTHLHTAAAVVTTTSSGNTALLSESTLSRQMAGVCSLVVSGRLHSHYPSQEALQRAGVLPLPWSLPHCLMAIQRFYRSVLLEAGLQKQCVKVAMDLHQLITINTTQEHNEKFIELCLSLLIYLKNGFPEYTTKITCLINDIKQMTFN